MKERILQFIDFKGITKNKFYKETGLSNGFLDKVNDIGVSKLEQILITYPEINPEFMIFGREPMIKNTCETPTKTNTEEELINTLKELLNSKDEQISLLKEKISTLQHEKSSPQKTH